MGHKGSSVAHLTRIPPEGIVQLLPQRGAGSLWKIRPHEAHKTLIPLVAGALRVHPLLKILVRLVLLLRK